MILKILRSTVFFLLVAAQLPAQMNVTPTSSGATETTRYEIPFDYTEGFMIIVRGAIGGHKNLHFVVDFGTTVTLIDREYAPAQAAGVKLEVTHFANSIQSTDVGINQLELGEMIIPDFRAFLVDLSQIPAVPQGIAGVIGLDVLERQSVMVDFAERRLVFGPTAGGEHKVPLLKCEVGYAVDAQWKGTPVKLALSTGVEVVTLDQDRMKTKPVKLNSLKQGALSTNYTVTPVSYFETKDMRLSDTKLEGPGVLRKMSWPYAKDALDGFLPLLALNADRVTIDFGHAVLSWEGTKLAKARTRQVNVPAQSFTNH
ncbi:MAG TPA: hypothetical protein VN025_21285 [Candidatus Dormibacteraeota bacterium]|jgi:hypothetical protein|nr:hypothetical protein [Candidatus Dormibacteraeota bacterium]